MIAVLDYGIGNLRSAQKALQAIGADAELARLPEEAEGASGVVVPGVGAFGPCVSALRGSGLESVVVEAVRAGTPLLGVCVGLQMLYEGSDEDPGVRGLGVLEGTVRALAETEKRPQMQWNVLRPVPGATGDSRMMAPFWPAGRAPWVYFVHSYAPVPPGGPQSAADGVVATCDYGGDVVAAIELGNIWGCQFHPEKSGSAGLSMLAAFVELCR